MGVYQKGQLEIFKGVGFTLFLIFFWYATSIFPIQPLLKQKLVFLIVPFQMSSFCLFSIILSLDRHFHTWLFLFYFYNINSIFIFYTLHIYNNLPEKVFSQNFHDLHLCFSSKCRTQTFLTRCLKLKSTSSLTSQMIVFCKKTENITI